MGIVKDYFQGFFKDYFRNRRMNKVWKQTYDLAKQEKYAEAAEIYARFAPELLEYNELVYCSYCNYAFEMWVKAGDAGNALEQARNVLHILIRNNGSWLKYNSGKYVDNLLTMVSKLYGANYTAEADIFSKEVNEQLEKYELPMRCVAAPVRKSKFPSLCMYCGAQIPYSPNEDAFECAYCDTVIYPH